MYGPGLGKETGILLVRNIVWKMKKISKIWGNKIEITSVYITWICGHAINFTNGFPQCGICHTNTPTRITSTRMCTSVYESNHTRTRGWVHHVCAKILYKAEWSRIEQSIALASVSPLYLMRDLGAVNHTDIAPYHSQHSVQGEGSNAGAHSRMVGSWCYTVSLAARIYVYMKPSAGRILIVRYT